MAQSANTYQITFCFPANPYEIDTIVETNVEPLWECHDQHVVGLFRIVVRLAFLQQPAAVIQTDHAIAIEAMDIDGQQGYFEYALPFEGEGEVERITVEKVEAHIEKGHRLDIRWHAHFTVQQPINEIIESSSLQIAPPIPKKQSNIFMNDLVEQYSIWRSTNLSPEKQRNNNK